MFGTNDADALSPAQFIADMRRIVEESEAQGVIPVLSTLPPRLDRRDANRRIIAYNAASPGSRSRRGSRSINYWRALSGRRIVNRGISEDGVHPSVFIDYECDPFCRPLEFTPRALRYGYNQRNLITLQTLRVLRESLFPP